MDQKKPSAALRALQGLLGAGLIALAIAGDRVDVMNNYWYGSTWNDEAAVIMACFGICLVLIPSAIAIGATRWLWLAYAVFLGVSGLCSYQAYMTKQVQNSTSASAVHEVYQDALQEKEQARLTLANIHEDGDVEQLAKQVADAESSVADAGKKAEIPCTYPSSKRCKEAEVKKADAQAKLEALRERLSRAKARDKAQATLAKAQAKQERGDAAIAKPDGDATIALIIGTQILTFLSKIGTGLIYRALRDLAPKPAKPKKASRDDPTDGGTRLDASAKVIRLHPQRHLVSQWLKEATAEDGAASMRGGDARKEYMRWAGHKIAPKELREILSSLLPDGSVTDRNSGYVVHGRRITAAAERKESRNKAAVS